MPVPAVAVAGLFGLIVGSFLNVVAHRLPAGASLVKPRSACPDCGTPVRPYDNVPVLSWLILRGRCRDCGGRIAARYPLVEAGTALLWVAVVAAHHADTTKLVLGLVLVTFLVPLAVIDLDHKLLPNKITGPAALVGLALGLAIDPGGEPERLLAATIAGGVIFLVALAMPSGMGMGDAKLLGVMGLYLGAAVAPAVFIALVSGTIVGIAIVVRLGVSRGRKTAVPFGVFLAFGAVAAIFAGDPMLDWYLTSF
jgi:leader peptidase (prepilin peptidase) / N-methyltransferase